MDDMRPLATEWAEVERRERLHADEPQHEFVIEAANAASIVLADLMQTASLVVVVASIFNGMENGTASPALLPATRSFLPRHGVLFADALARLSTDTSAAGAVKKMQEFCHALDLAGRLTMTHSSATDLVPGSDELVRTASAWRGCCALARAAVTRVADIARADAVSGRPEALRTLRGLVAAADGQTPALRQNGILVPPTWAERRLEPRQCSDEPAVVEWWGDRVPARILDHSARGARLRLERRMIIAPGDHLTLVRPDGKTRSAAVRWADSTCLALEYATQKGSTR